MSVLVTVDGVSYTIPDVGEEDWGNNLTLFLEALANVSLKIKGGSIPLTSEADFGATAGLKSLWFASRTANSASVGILRLSNLDPVNWRNAANSADLTLTVDASDNLTYNGNDVLTTANAGTSIPNGTITTAMIIDDAVDKDKINADIAGSGLGQNVDGSLEVNVDDVGIEIDTDTLRLKDSGVVTAKINNDAVDKDKINADVAGNGLGQNGDGSLEVNVDDSTIEINTDIVRVKDLGITTAKIAASNVTSAKLENDIVLPGTGAVKIPTGSTAQRPGSPTNSMFRYNETANKFEGYQNGAWGEIGGGGGVSGVKNYIINPSASLDTTTGVSDTTAGTWTITRSTTASEQPYESSPTCYKISGSGLAVNDTVEFAILSTFIDDADGGRIGSWKVGVKDISGTIEGEYKFQVYNVTDAIYVGDSQTVIAGDFTYEGSVPLDGGADYELHLITLAPAPTNIGISNITISPDSIVYGSRGGWKVYDQTATSITLTGATSPVLYFTSLIPYKDPTSDIWRLRLNIVFGHAASVNTTVTLANTVFKNTTNAFQAVGCSGGGGAQGQAFVTPNAGSISTTYIAGSTFTLLSGDVELESKPTWADYDDTIPTLTQALLANSEARFYRSAGGTHTSGTEFPFDTADITTFDAPIGITNTSGVFTVLSGGNFEISALVTSSGWAANTQMTLHVDRGSGLTQEQTIARPGAASYSILGNCSVKLAAGNTFEIQLNDTKTMTIGSSLCWIVIRKSNKNTGTATGLPFLGDTTTGTGEIGLVNQQATTADIGGAPSQSDFNNLLQKLRDAGVIDG